MVYRFSYTNNGRLIYESYTDDKKAMLRFALLVNLNIPFKIITITKRHNKFI